MGKLKSIFLLIRVHQYLKNLFIFLPLFFALKITDLNLLKLAALTFLGFCLVASSIYIFNDYLDIEQDKKHPKKKNRPLAKGDISKSSALVLMLFLLVSGMFLLFKINNKTFCIVLAYFFLNVLYTLKLKHIPIIDIFVISIGFVLRIFAGGFSTNIKLSSWIVLMTFLLALFLSLAKRRDDLLIYLKTGEKMRKSIDGYNLDVLNYSMVIMAAVTIVSYIMYTLSPVVILNAKTDQLYLTVIFVIMGIMRYIQITFAEEKSGSPTEVLMKDKIIKFSVLAWITSIGVLIYKW